MFPQLPSAVSDWYNGTVAGMMKSIYPGFGHIILICDIYHLATCKIIVISTSREISVSKLFL